MIYCQNVRPYIVVKYNANKWCWFYVTLLVYCRELSKSSISATYCSRCVFLRPRAPWESIKCRASQPAWTLPRDYWPLPTFISYISRSAFHLQKSIEEIPWFIMKATENYSHHAVFSEFSCYETARKQHQSANQEDRNCSEKLVLMMKRHVAQQNANKMPAECFLVNISFEIDFKLLQIDVL